MLPKAESAEATVKSNVMAVLVLVLVIEQINNECTQVADAS